MKRLATVLTMLLTLSSRSAGQDERNSAVGLRASAQAIVLIRPGSSGLLPDQETVQRLLTSWRWPESINPQPAADSLSDTRPYFVGFEKLESRHDDAILGIVSVGANTEPQAARRALQEVVAYLQSSLEEIATAIEESHRVDAESLAAQVHAQEGEIEALEARDVELRSEGEVDQPESWQAQLHAVRAQLANASAQVGEHQMRLAYTRDQLAQAKKAAEESAASGAQSLHALQQLAAMQQEEVQRAIQLVKSGTLSQSELNAARERMLLAEIQLREKQQELSQQVDVPLRRLSEQEQTLSREVQALEQQRQSLEGQLAKLQSPETRAALLERQRLRRQLERARQRLSEAEHGLEYLSRRQPDARAPRVIRIEPKPVQ